MEGDTMSTEFIPSQPGVSHLYPYHVLYRSEVNGSRDVFHDMVISLHLYFAGKGVISKEILFLNGV